MSVFLRISATVVLAVVLLFYVKTAHAQTVGLVLGGGGAKGFSHIGVLKALEKHHIPIDYITGTSIGAIVGGLYAAGYSPQEIEQIALSGKFEEWAAGIIDDKYHAYYLSGEPNPALGNFRLEYDSVWRPVLPTSLRSPVVLDFIVQKYFARANVASGYDFDSLMIPFRCVAADINANQAKVLSNGDLGKAIRASMTFPFVFKPIRIEGKLLYDGGMYNNFPADVMFEEFKPDIMIGSKAADNYAPPVDDNIITHLQTMLMEKTDYSVIGDSSVLIQPDLSEFNVLRFKNPKPIIDSGYYETLKYIDKIRNFLNDSLKPDDAEQRREAFNSKAPPIMVDRINVAGLTHQQFKFVNVFFKQNFFVGDSFEPIPIDKLKEEYLRLAALDLFFRISPEITLDNSTDYYTLNLEMDRKATMAINFGGVVSTNPINEAFVELNYQFLRRHIHTISLNTYFGRFYNSVKLQDRIDFPLQANLYLLGAFTINHWNYFRSSTAFIEDQTPSYLIERDRHGRLLLGKGVGKKGKTEFDIAAGVLAKDYYNTSDYRRKDTLDRTSFRFFSPGLVLDFNTLNRVHFATSGTRFRVAMRYISGTEYHRPGTTSIMKENSENESDWFTFNATYKSFTPLNNLWTGGFAISSAFSNQKTFNNYTASVLFAPLWLPIPEAQTLFLPQIRAYSYFAFGGILVRRLTENIDFRFETHLFNPYRELRQTDGQQAYVKDNFTNVYGIVSVASIFHSPVGPVSLTLNYYHKSPVPVSLSLTFGNILFNRKAWF